MSNQLLAIAHGMFTLKGLDAGLLILRVVVGITLAMHGLNKIFGGGKIPGTAGWFESMGVLTATELLQAEHGSRVLIGGVVTHRQRPATAAGITFLNIEDETGLINVICSPGLWKRYRRVARTAAALLVRGRLERVEGVTNIIADRLELLPVASPTRSRDFH